MQTIYCLSHSAMNFATPPSTNHPTLLNGFFLKLLKKNADLFNYRPEAMEDADKMIMREKIEDLQM